MQILDLSRQQVAEPPVSSPAPRILFRDPSWGPNAPLHLGGAFWCFSTIGDSATGAIEIGYWVVPDKGQVTQLYLTLVGGGITMGELGRVKFLSPSDALFSDFALNQVMVNISGQPVNEASVVYRFPVSLVDAGLSPGVTFKLRVEDNDDRNIPFGTVGVVPEILFGV